MHSIIPELEEILEDYQNMLRTVHNRHARWEIERKIKNYKEAIEVLDLWQRFRSITRWK